jgi:2-(1,2-epoxy-1,2-dihydrophenyl)acetyl-CoA isomerase
MKSDLIKTKQKGSLFYIVLNRPDKLNSLIEPMRSEISTLIDSLHHRSDIRACIITGAGRGFCSGGDIKLMEQIIDNKSYECIQTFLEWGKSIICGIRNLPIPVIAAINGPAAGAGMNLALACDLRLASDRATFGQTFINIGLHADWGGTYFLPRLVGVSNALEMFWTGRIIDSTEAHRLGIVNTVISHDIFVKKVEELAQNITSHSKKVVSLIKKGVYEGLKSDLETVLEHEALAQSECIRSEEAYKGMQHFLKERARRKEKK